MDAKFFDEDYYERGLQTGKSCYQNYIWIPELTIPFAMALIDNLKITKEHTILDYGCSKGFLVKALRMLHRKAWGVDISEYALNNVPEDIKIFCHKVGEIDSMFFDFCIAKDVFEHIPVEELTGILKELKTKTLYSIIPLGCNGKYYAESNNMDKSHVICEDDIWWKNFFLSVGWQLIDFTYNVDGIKESYRTIPKAHGFFTLKNKKENDL